MTRLLPILVSGAAAVVLATAGCGSSTSALARENAALSERSDNAMLQFAHCMRAHGINMRDPFHRPGHSGLSIDLPTQSPATKSAYAACGHILQPIIQMKEAHAPQMPAANRVALVRYAECMRTRNVPMLDPDRFGNLNLGNVPGIAVGFGRYTPQFHLADAQCRHLLPAGLHDNGTGP
jgi:hypothetical protein